MQTKTPHYNGIISISITHDYLTFQLTNAMKPNPSWAAKKLLSYKNFPLFTQPKKHYHASGPNCKPYESSQGTPVLFCMIHFNIILLCIHPHLLGVHCILLHSSFQVYWPKSCMHFWSLALPAYFILLYFIILRFADSTNYDTITMPFSLTAHNIIVPTTNGSKHSFPYFCHFSWRIYRV